MTGSASQAGSSFGDAVKKGVGMFHGTGEAIRGNFNAAVDSATGDRASAQQHEKVAARGIDEFEHGHHHQHGTGAGVTPVDQDRGNEFRTTTTSSNYGPHGTNVGNKLDPRVDSDLDHRAVPRGPTNLANERSPFPCSQSHRTSYRGWRSFDDWPPSVQSNNAHIRDKVDDIGIQDPNRPSSEPAIGFQHQSPGVAVPVVDQSAPNALPSISNTPPTFLKLQDTAEKSCCAHSDSATIPTSDNMPTGHDAVLGAHSQGEFLRLNDPNNDRNSRNSAGKPCCSCLGRTGEVD